MGRYVQLRIQGFFGSLALTRATARKVESVVAREAQYRDGRVRRPFSRFECRVNPTVGPTGKESSMTLAPAFDMMEREQVRVGLSTTGAHPISVSGERFLLDPSAPLDHVVSFRRRRLMRTHASVSALAGVTRVAQCLVPGRVVTSNQGRVDLVPAPGLVDLSRRIDVVDREKRQRRQAAARTRQPVMLEDQPSKFRPALDHSALRARLAAVAGRGVLLVSRILARFSGSHDSILFYRLQAV